MPQGSVFGPILYVVYVDNLLSSLPDNSVIAYADDVTLDANRSMVEKLLFNLQTLLNAVYSWSTDNALNLNTSKCFIMHITLFLRS